MPSLEIKLCSGDVNTCPVVKKCFEYDEFAAITESIDPAEAENRQMLGDFVTSCVKGTCIGQHPEEAIACLRSLIDRSNPEH